MKKVFSIVAIAMFIAFACVSCQKSTKDQILGSWDLTLNENDDETNGTIEGVQTFDKDGKFSLKATADVSGETEANGNKIKLKFVASIKQSGDWSVEEKTIVLSPTKTTWDLESCKYYDPDTDQLLYTATGADLKELKEEMNDGGFMKSLNEASKEKIIMLKDDKMVTEQDDEDGGTTTCTYNRR